MALFECAVNDRNRSISIPLAHADCATRLREQRGRVSDSASSEETERGEEQTKRDSSSK
jgi:hypothetical protein